MASRTETKLIETFNAVDDSGQEYKINLYQEYILSDGDRIPSFRRLQQPDGGAVNMIDESTFELVQSETIVKRL